MLRYRARMGRELCVTFEYHLVAVPAEFTLIHGRFGQPEKNPPERQAEIPGIFLPHE